MTGAIEFGTFTTEERVNPYAETVTKLSELNDPNASVTLTVDYDDKVKEQFKFQRAANAIGKTARLRKIDDSAVEEIGVDEDGHSVFAGVVRLTFTLTKMHKGRRGASAGASQAEDQDAGEASE